MGASAVIRVVQDTNGAGIAAMAKRIEAMASQRVLVGVPSTAPKAENGSSMATIAAIMEFGGHVAPHERQIRFSAGQYAKGKFRFAKKTAKTSILARANFANGITIPERPFLRTGIRRNLQFFSRFSRSRVARVVRGQMTMSTALGQLGEAAAGKIKREIVDGNWTPNAPTTIRKKGSDRPLIDSGALRASVTYVIDGGPPPVQGGHP